MKVTTFRVPQFSAKRITVVCVDGEPICTVRGNETLSKIISRLNGYDVSSGDKRIDKVIDKKMRTEGE